MYRYNAAYKEINDVSLERMKMAVEYIDRYDIIIIDLCYLMSDIKRKGAAMIVSGKNSPKVRKIYKERSEKAIKYARRQIEESPVAPYVSKLYLYGSCVREEQTYQSDVDLMLELEPTFDINRLRDEIILLKSRVNPGELDMPEVDLKVVICDEWKAEHTLYFENIKKEGRDIWQDE